MEKQIQKKEQKEVKELKELEYSNAFEAFIDRLSNGELLVNIISEDNRGFSYADFMRWINKDSERKRRYEEAFEISSEFIASEMLQIADTAEEHKAALSKAKLRIETRKTLISAWSKKYQKADIEIPVSININQVLAEARGRLSKGEYIDV